MQRSIWQRLKTSSCSHADIQRPQTRSRSILARFKNDTKDERSLTVLPDVPVTGKYPPPAGLDWQGLHNPGLPRVSSIPDRFHPEEDGAEPPYDKGTVLQQHVAFFDYDKDGIIWPSDTFKGFRDIGYNPVVSFIAPFVIHSSFSLPTQDRWWLPDLRFPIYVKNIHRCKHGSDSNTYDHEGRFVPMNFEQMFSKFDKGDKGGLTYKELMEMIREHTMVYDLFGRTASFLEWTVTYYGFKDENGVLPREAMRKQFNGSLFYEYAKKIGKNLQAKKGHDQLPR